METKIYLLVLVLFHMCFKLWFQISDHLCYQKYSKNSNIVKIFVQFKPKSVATNSNDAQT